ncbi:MAG TPA: hypothetical protein VGV38_22840 [Pyrinomonadaceae bacterium]|nr:hypothetical protein [Pyrinomonadaceae bacterium]
MKKTKKVEKNWLEWTVFGVGLALVLGTLGFLVYDGARAIDAQPDVKIRLGAVEQRGEQFVVPVVVTNEGEATAEGVQVEVVLEQDGEQLERGEFAVAFLPRRAKREGWVAFRTDPRAAQLKPRVLGYEKP